MYKKLKEQLIARIADSKHQKLWQLLTTKELRDSSQHSCCIKCNCCWMKRRISLIVCFWVNYSYNASPRMYKMILASADMMTINKLVKMADRIMDLATPVISSVSTPTKGGDFRRIICKKVAAVLLTQERSHPQFSANWKKGGRNHSLQHSGWRCPSPGK